MQQRQQWLPAFSLLLATLLLSACGWHLRGYQPLPEELKTLYLEVPNENSKLTRSLRRSLKSMGVTLVDSAAQAKVTLVIDDIQHKRRTVSTSGRGKAAEYELTSILTYSIHDANGERLLGPDTISVEKVYLFDPDRVVGAFEEEQLLREEMQRDLITQLIRRYRAAKPSQANDSDSTAQD